MFDIFFTGAEHGFGVPLGFPSNLTRGMWQWTVVKCSDEWGDHPGISQLDVAAESQRSGNLKC